MMSKLEHDAMDFATKAHEGQLRKYSKEPYIVHPAEVASIVRGVGHDEEMLAMAWLHDVVEDCGVDLRTIQDKFGYVVMVGVFYLSDVSGGFKGNRRMRKTMDRLHISGAPPQVKTVKLADVISNSSTILANDPEFAKVYIGEKMELLSVLREGDMKLWQQAYKICDDYYNTVVEKESNVLQTDKT